MKIIKVDDVETDIFKYWELSNTFKFMEDINKIDDVRFEDIDSIKQIYYNEFLS